MPGGTFGCARGAKGAGGRNEYQRHSKVAFLAGLTVALRVDVGALLPCGGSRYAQMLGDAFSLDPEAAPILL